MRLAILSDLEKWSWAGCEELWLALAGGASLAGDQVDIFLNRSNLPAQRSQELTQMGVRVHQPAGVPALADGARRISWKLGRALDALSPRFAKLRALSPDVVFINLGDAVPKDIFLDQLQRSGVLELPYVIACHNSYLFGQPIEGAARKAVVECYKGADCVFFVAERTRRETEHLIATHLERVRVIRNPVNMRDLGAIPPPESSTVRIASIGRVAIHSKGQDILLAALASREWKQRDWKLSIYGDGPHRYHLDLLAQHYGIRDRVCFEGYSNDVRAIWAANHILALPSRNESAPLTLVEAMLCGRPSVVNDVGGIREWVSEPDTAFVSAGTQIESFAAALERAWRSRSSWTSMGMRAREKALRMYDPAAGLTLRNILAELAGKTAIESQPCVAMAEV